MTCTVCRLPITIHDEWVRFSGTTLAHSTCADAVGADLAAYERVRGLAAWHAVGVSEAEYHDRQIERDMALRGAEGA